MFDMAFASDAADRNAHTPTDGNHDQGTVFGSFFTLAKTFTAFFGFGGVQGQFAGQPRRTDAASHTDPGRGRGPLEGAPRAPADR